MVSVGGVGKCGWGGYVWVGWVSVGGVGTCGWGG